MGKGQRKGGQGIDELASTTGIDVIFSTLRSGTQIKGYGNQGREGSEKKVTSPEKKDPVPVPKPKEGPEANLEANKHNEVFPNGYALYMRIRTREAGTLHWNPIRVQMEVDRYDEARWRERFSDVFAAYVLVKLFNWAAQ